MSMKNSKYTSWDRTSDLPICSTAPWPLCRRGPRLIQLQYIVLYLNGKIDQTLENKYFRLPFQKD